MAALKGESDIAVGNAVGSNTFNLLGVLGIGAVVARGNTLASRTIQFDLPVMIFVALVSLPVFYIDRRISRFEGGLLLSYYVLYVAYVILRAMESSTLAGMTMFIDFFVVLTFWRFWSSRFAPCARKIQ